MSTYIPYPPKAHRIPANDEEWHRFRREGFDPSSPIPVTMGGSDVGKIFLADRKKPEFEYFMNDKAVRWLGSEAKARQYLRNLNNETSYSPLLELFLEKTCQLTKRDFFIKRPIDTDATRVGHFFESFVRWRCEESMGCSINPQPGAFQGGHPDYDFLIANPDGFIESLSGEFKGIGGQKIRVNGVPCVWEGKTVDPDMSDVVRGWKNGFIPFKYEMQIRFYMAVLNVNYALISCAWGFQKRLSAHILVCRDLEIEERMLKRILEFRDSVLSGDAPPLDGTLEQRMDMLKRDLRRCSNTASTAMLPSALYSSIAVRYDKLLKVKKSLDEKVKLVTEEIKECETELMSAMGAASTALVNTPRKTLKFSVSRYNRETIKKDALEKKYPGVWDEVKSSSPYVKTSLKGER